jgi:hypothetical protein
VALLRDLAAADLMGKQTPAPAPPQPEPAPVASSESTKEFDIEVVKDLLSAYMINRASHD